MSPLPVLIITRLSAILWTSLFPSGLSWIPTFLSYYLLIAAMMAVSVRYAGVPKELFFALRFRPFPRTGLFVLAILIPALLPVMAFVSQISRVPGVFIIYILIFSCINPFFEEWYWRGVLSRLSYKKWFVILYSAGLFAFSHYFLWTYWFKHPMIIIPTVISTFLMGIAWMFYMKKGGNILYPILSHVVVDILNLSVAVYAGVIDFGHFG